MGLLIDGPSPGKCQSRHPAVKHEKDVIPRTEQDTTCSEDHGARKSIIKMDELSDYKTSIVSSVDPIDFSVSAL